MIIQFKGKEFKAKTLADASAIYSHARDVSGLGASKWPCGRVLSDSGEWLYHVSYNGRIWDKSQATNWTPSAVPVYDNRDQVAS